MQSRRRFLNRFTKGSLGFWAVSQASFSQNIEKTSASKTNLPVINDVDICVLGGSCTGVFAAVRASRLGARVAIVEKQNAFGGVATSGLVNIWHSLFNTEVNKQIIAGLTSEVIERLAKRDQVNNYAEDKKGAWRLNTQELKIELDELVLESGIKP